MRRHPLHATLHPLAPFASDVDTPTIAREVKKVWRLITRSPHWSSIHRNLTTLASTGSLVAHAVDLSGDIITADLDESADIEALRSLSMSLVSWRVGPYQLGPLFLDSEWQSHMKWQRISPLIPRQEGMRIADVGCSNGYFLYKLSTLKPEIAVGFDPIERCWLQFALLQSILNIPRLAFLPMGLLDLHAVTSFFDLVLCMGVLYHQRDQLLAVQHLFNATRPGGHVILESLVVDRDDPLVITPPDRYAKMRNAWTIPSAASLETLFSRVGFKEVEVKRFGALTTTEQRSTPFAPYESLADFLDLNDSSRTVEGHPAPHTAVVIGRR